VRVKTIVKMQMKLSWKRNHSDGGAADAASISGQRLPRERLWPDE
jgi:hypothetical protein